MSALGSTLSDIPTLVNDIISDTFIGHTFLFGFKLSPTKKREFAKNPKGAITFDMLFGKAESEERGGGLLDKVSVFGSKKSFSANIAWQILMLPNTRGRFITSLYKLKLLTEKMIVMNRNKDDGNIDAISLTSSEDILSSFKSLSYAEESRGSSQINPSFSNDQRSLVFTCDVKNATCSSNTVDHNHSRSHNINNRTNREVRSTNKRKLDDISCERDVTFDCYSQMFDSMDIPASFLTNKTCHESRSRGSPKLACVQHVLDMSRDVDERTLRTSEDNLEDFFVADSFLEDISTTDDNKQKIVEVSCKLNNSLSLKNCFRLFPTDVTKPIVNNTLTKDGSSKALVNDTPRKDDSSTEQSSCSTGAGPEEKYFTGVDWTVDESCNLDTIERIMNDLPDVNNTFTAANDYLSKQSETDSRTKQLVDNDILADNQLVGNPCCQILATSHDNDLIPEECEMMRCDKHVESSIVLNVSRVSCDDSYISQDLCAASLPRFMINMPKVGFSPQNHLQLKGTKEDISNINECLLQDLTCFNDTLDSWDGHTSNVALSQSDRVCTRVVSKNCDNILCSQVNVCTKSLSCHVVIAGENNLDHLCTLKKERSCSNDQVHLKNVPFTEGPGPLEETLYAEDRVHLEEMPYSEDLEAFLAGSMTEGSSSCYVNSVRLKSPNMRTDATTITDHRLTNDEMSIVKPAVISVTSCEIIGHEDTCVRLSVSDSVILESSFCESPVPESICTAMCTNNRVILSPSSQSSLLRETNMLQSRPRNTATKQHVTNRTMLSDSVCKDSNTQCADTVAMRLNKDVYKLCNDSNSREDRVLGCILNCDVLSDSCELFSCTPSSLCSPRTDSNEVTCNSYKKCPFMSRVSLCSTEATRCLPSSVTTDKSFDDPIFQQNHDKENSQKSVSFISTLSAMNFSHWNRNIATQPKIILELNNISPQQKNVQFCKKLTTVVMMSDEDNFIPQTPATQGLLTPSVQGLQTSGVQGPIKSCLRQTPRNGLPGRLKREERQDMGRKGISATPLSKGFDIVAQSRGAINERLRPTNRELMSVTLNKELYPSSYLTDLVSYNVIAESRPNNLNEMSTDIDNSASSKVVPSVSNCNDVLINKGNNRSVSVSCKRSGSKKPDTEPCLSSNVSGDLFQTKSNTSTDCDLFIDDVSFKRCNSLQRGGGVDCSTRYSSSLACSTPLLHHRPRGVRVTPLLLRKFNEPSPVLTNHKQASVSCDRKLTCDSPAVILNVRKCAKVEISKASLHSCSYIENRGEEINDGLESLNDSSLCNNSLENISLSHSLEGVGVSQSQDNVSNFRLGVDCDSCSIDLFEESVADQFHQNLSRLGSSSGDLFE